MDLKEPNNTCDIYRRKISELREQGDVQELARLVQTWYSRCDFRKGFNSETILDLGVKDNGVVWIKMKCGTVEYCCERNRWRLVENLVEHREASQCQYMMARIAEITEVPFAYLCGVRDAISVIEDGLRENLSGQVRNLSAKHAKLSSEIRKKRIAVESVFVDLDEQATEARVATLKYPDAPRGTLSWDLVRSAFRDTAGIYFAWDGDEVVYVGATEKGMHCRLQSGHHAVSRGDLFSFVEMPFNEVYFAEHYYIAKYAPKRNACVAQALGVREGGHRGKRKR